jgi:hypothetical protein
MKGMFCNSFDSQGVSRSAASAARIVYYRPRYARPQDIPAAGILFAFPEYEVRDRIGWRVAPYIRHSDCLQRIGKLTTIMK